MLRLFITPLILAFTTTPTFAMNAVNDNFKIADEVECNDVLTKVRKHIDGHLSSLPVMLDGIRGLVEISSRANANLHHVRSKNVFIRLAKFYSDALLNLELAQLHDVKLPKDTKQGLLLLQRVVNDPRFAKIAHDNDVRLGPLYVLGRPTVERFCSDVSVTSKQVDWLFQFPAHIEELEHRIHLAHDHNDDSETLAMELMSLAVDVQEFVSEGRDQLQPDSEYVDLLEGLCGQALELIESEMAKPAVARSQTLTFEIAKLRNVRLHLRDPRGI